jgi:hypothetical protein
MKTTELRKLIREEIKKAIKEVDYGVTLSSDRGKQARDDEDMFKLAKPIFIKAVNSKKIVGNVRAFIKLVDDLTVANNKFMHTDWKKNADAYFYKNVAPALSK